MRRLSLRRTQRSPKELPRLEKMYQPQARSKGSVQMSLTVRERKSRDVRCGNGGDADVAGCEGRKKSVTRWFHPGIKGSVLMLVVETEEIPVWARMAYVPAVPMSTTPGPGEARDARGAALAVKARSERVRAEMRDMLEKVWKEVREVE